MTATFIVTYETHDERRLDEHKINVSPMDGETNWEALIRAIQARGVKLIRARVA